MNNNMLVKKRMEKLLENGNFELSEKFLKKVHKTLFFKINEPCGEYRITNISKSEDILDGDSVLYAIFYNIDTYMTYDFEDEKNKDYSLMNNEEVISNITDFTIRLWSTHPFLDGNTRTISLFVRLYLKSLGFKMDNYLFLENFSYYRNALVRAVYNNGNIIGNDTFLRSFYEKLLFNKNIVLDESSLVLNKCDVKRKIKEIKMFKN